MLVSVNRLIRRVLTLIFLPALYVASFRVKKPTKSSAAMPLVSQNPA